MMTPDKTNRRGTNRRTVFPKRPWLARPSANRLAVVRRSVTMALSAAVVACGLAQAADNAAPEACRCGGNVSQHANAGRINPQGHAAQADFYLPVYASQADPAVLRSLEELGRRDATVTREAVDRVFADFNDVYPDIQFRAEWENNTVNAFAWRSGNQRFVAIMGGMLRHRFMQIEGVTLVLAHEVGHHHGGDPLYPGSDLSCEGQSDYWATLVGLRNIYNDPADPDNDTREYQLIVERGIDQTYALLSGGLRYNFNSFEHLSRTAFADDPCDHPHPDCRRLTYDAGYRREPKPDCAGLIPSEFLSRGSFRTNTTPTVGRPTTVDELMQRARGGRGARSAREIDAPALYRDRQEQIRSGESGRARPYTEPDYRRYDDRRSESLERSRYRRSDEESPAAPAREDRTWPHGSRADGSGPTSSDRGGDNFSDRRAGRTALPDAGGESSIGESILSQPARRFAGEQQRKQEILNEARRMAESVVPSPEENPAEFVEALEQAYTALERRDTGVRSADDTAAPRDAGPRRMERSGELRELLRRPTERRESDTRARDLESPRGARLQPVPHKQVLLRNDQRARSRELITSPSRLKERPQYAANLAKLYLTPGMHPRITGGTDVPPTELRHCVAVGGPIGWCCTGTLIGPNVVITAGHCDGECTSRVFVGNDVELATSQDIYRVKKAIRHRGYRVAGPDVIENDVTLLILDRPVQGVRPAQMALSDDIDRAEICRLAGFGAVESDGYYYGLKQMVDVAVESAACNGSDSSRYGCVIDKEIVAGGGGLDSCGGDSGGPLYIKVDGDWLLAGATSRATAEWRLNGEPCGEGGNYVRLDRYLSWIRDVANDNGGDLDSSIAMGFQNKNP